ncbi:MAG: adenylosuccinate lyase [Gammaproteobacteria bacterium]|nr:adenylosuccinate lyase [Gammaproteobacteria bacterium]MBT5863335.1 adenylosuccinate lyase [Gammaproteobacteria bacterium]MBT6734709.1 adenylosuccinate lyase [Gammaproteobacteria bacterium]MBT7237216.1 adenylosuccinate lyase [Gammaproteobacteria bacterium]
MKKDDLLSISPLDGRYSDVCKDIGDVFSEYSLIKHRVYVEIKWFIFLSKIDKIKGLPKLKPKDEKFLLDIYNDFSLSDARSVKKLESTTKHDVKAIEYFLKLKFDTNKNLKRYKEYIHICCTSEDINNLSYALMLKTGKTLLSAKINGLSKLIKSNIRKYSNNIMLSHTHGQPATPTSMGKEFLNFYSRINILQKHLKELEIMGKFNGATGNYSAHSITFPNIDWLATNKRFINSIGIKENKYTTQIEPHDYISEISNKIAHVNSILIGFSQDMWSYISKNYFIQKNIAGEIGSSTMPHKINPINFENAEGNLGIANSIFRFLSEKLTISRLQRDLSDSTVLRNLGISFGYSYLAYENLMAGLNKLSINKYKIDEDIINAWEILAEPIQMVARKHNISNSYELLKKNTRGKAVTKDVIHNLIKSLKIPDVEKKQLFDLTPKKYIGYAVKLCNEKY